MRRTLFISLILLLALPAFSLDDGPDSSASPASVSFNDHGDPVLRAMIAELKRSQENLQLGQMQRPYYIDYEVTEVKDYVADAMLGALRSDQGHAGRAVRVVVRIGDYKQDSYFGEGTGSGEAMPLDNEPLALRHQLWLATDKAYKSALNGLTEKQAALKNVVVETELPDFSQEKPGDFVASLRTTDIDLEAWKQQIRRTSDLFRSDPELESSSAFLHVRVMNRYFVNTEGTITRNGSTVYTLAFDGSAQAEDGMRIDRSHAYVVASPNELPKPEQVRKEARELIATF